MKIISKDQIEGLRKGIFKQEHISLVKSIVDDVKDNGDEALFRYSRRFDGIELDKHNIKISKEEIKDSYSKVDDKIIEAFRFMKDRLSKVEEETLKAIRDISIEVDGIRIEKRFVAIDSTGCYIPYGKAKYPSSLVMCSIPARVAGVKRIAITSPLKDLDPFMLVAADICNIDEIYRVGGAQAIAALAYGTESIKKVDKIVGPGGIFVTIAKYLVSKDVGIDMLAGPTELLIIADSNANARFIASDIIAQAEHSNDTLCGLITDSKELADKVSREIDNMLNSIERRDIVRSSLDSNGFIIISKDMDEAARLANIIAPEHLEIIANNAYEISNSITSAGLILVNEYSSSAASDYVFGTNHVLPTLAYARVRGGLSCLDFLKLVTYASASRDALSEVKDYIDILSRLEGLPNHARACGVRYEG